MSHKRKPENLAFSITVTPDKRKKSTDEDKTSFAVLAPFNPFPKICFENVKLKSTATQEVYLVNPTESILQVELTKLPEEARGYEWSAVDFELPKESQVKLVISWTPTVYGSWHDTVKIINKKTRKPLSELKLSSTTEEGPKVKKRGYLIKKPNCSQKNEILKKCTIKTKSENKENEFNFVNEYKKEVQSEVAVKTENIIIYESKNPFHNRTYTQIKEEDIDEQHFKKISETNIQPDVTITLSQNQNKLQPELSTPRRSTYDVIEPVISSRRSTYALRQRQISNIIDVEQEKKEFELLASPGIHSKSIENAASKLLSKNATGRLTAVSEVESFKPSCSTTFTVHPSSPHTGFKDPSCSSFTYNIKEEPSPLTIPPNMILIDKEAHVDKVSDRFSMESVVSSERFYDSLEGRLSIDSLERGPELEVNEKEDLFVDWDDVFNFDKFSTKTSENLTHTKCSVEKLSQKQDESQSNLKSLKRKSDLLYRGVTYSEQELALSNNSPTTFPLKHTMNRKNMSSFQTLSPSSYKEPQISQNLVQQKSFNQTKDTFLQLDEDFGKFNFSIASSSPVNSKNTILNNHNRTCAQLHSNSAVKDYEKQNVAFNSGSADCEKPLFLDSNIEDGHLGQSKCIKIHDPIHVRKDLDRSELKNITGINISSEENNFSDGIKHNVLEHENKEMKTPLLTVNEHSKKQQSNVLDVTKWNISPPQKRKEEEKPDNRNADHVPRIKTPMTFLGPKSSSSADTNISQLRKKHSLRGNSNFKELTDLTSTARVIPPNSKNMVTEGVFLVPQIKIKRSSLQQTINGPSPKVKRLSQDQKMKRLSTPSSTRKHPLKCATEERKPHKVDITRSARITKERRSLKADWVPAVRKLTLTSTSSQSEGDLSEGYSADLATPDPFLAATSLNPFSKGGLYLNNKWLKEQEVELIQWTDRMLRPPNELELDRDQSERDTLHRLNALRTSAFNMLTSTEVATVLSKVKKAVEKNFISIRSDKQLHADLGLQDKIITLLMSYNPLWLRLCLEVVYQCNIQLRRHSDESGLRDFIRRYVLNDETLRREYAHPTVPHLMLPEFEEEMKKFTVYKFLVVVYLLDLVKREKVILHDPCLFKKDSKLKSSKEILIDFNKEFVAGAGDITRILRSRGYEVSHCQTYIDEFDFSLTSAKELRDGVRLTRLAEKLVGDKNICTKLRVPAVSNLQKKYNAEVALSAIVKGGYDIPPEISPKDISDGHNEKTLSLLWHLREIFQKRAVSIIITKWRETKLLRNDRKNFLKTKSSAIKIQRWYRNIKKASSISPEEKKKCCEARENFLKLKDVAVRLQRNFRKRKEERDFKRKCDAAVKIQNWYRNQKRLLIERNHFKALRQAASTIQRAYRNYKSKKSGCALDERTHFLKMRTAALTIQRRFRAWKQAKLQRENFLAMKSATLTIQRRFRAWKQGKFHRENTLALKSATLTIQRRFRAWKQGKLQRENFLAVKSATLTIQRRFRAWKQGKLHRENMLALKSATLTIQRRFRAWKQGKLQRENFLAVKSATLTIQRRFRAWKQDKLHRENMLALKSATLTIQRRFRAWKQGKLQRENFLVMKSATLKIQRRFRAWKQGKLQRENLLAMKSATLTIQRRFRACKQGKLQRENFLAVKSATLTIQRRFKAWKQGKLHRENFLAMKSATLTIQRKFRAWKQGKLQRENLLAMKSATLTIQRRFRAWKQGKLQRENFLAVKSATLTIQTRFRAWKQGKLQRENFLAMKSATLTIQRRFRAWKQSKLQRENFLAVKSATLTIQRRFRAWKQGKLQRENFLAVKSATLTIQRRFKACKQGKLQRENFLAMKSTTLTIQRRFRAWKQGKLQRENFLAVKSATLTIQRRFKACKQGKLQRENFLAVKSATLIIQRRFRAWKQGKLQRENFLAVKSATLTIQRRFRAVIVAKQVRREYLSLKCATIYIQRSFRAKKIAEDHRQNFIRLRMAAITLQRKYRENRARKNISEQAIISRRIDAAIKIQAAWRGYVTRKTVKIPQPPKGMPTSSTDSHETLSTRGKRYLHILSNLREYSIAQLQSILCNIDRVTVMSAEQCEYYVKNNAVKILYKFLMHYSNRSLGVDRCVELILSILLNLYRAPAVAEAVWQETREVNGIVGIFDLIMLFKTEKTSTVFCKGCTVIWLFAQDPVKAELIMKTPGVQETYKYIVKTMKKNEMPGPSGLKQTSKTPRPSGLPAKKSETGTKKKFPALRFNWGGYFNDIRAFDDKYIALNSVIDKLDGFKNT